MPRRTLTEHDLDDPIYQSRISLLVGGDDKDLYAFLRARHGKKCKILNKDGSEAEARRGPGESGTDGMQFHIGGEEEHFYIWIARPELDLLYHEMMHLVFDVLYCRGIEYGDTCEDAFCYWGAAVFEQAHLQVFGLRALSTSKK